MSATDSGSTMTIAAPAAIPLADVMADWRRDAAHGTVYTGRYRAPYFVWGTGPPLVFIHGLADRARSFAPVMHHLRRQFTCIGYELPDGGPDGARLAAYHHRHLIDDLLALVDHLKLERTYLLGSSFGSTIALAAMHARPERFPRAILQGGFAKRSMARWEMLIARFGRYWPGSFGTIPFRHRFHAPAEYGVFRSLGMSEMLQFLIANSGEVSKAAVAWRGGLVARIDLRAKLPAIRQPVLMICGELDSIVRRECEPALLAGLPNVDRVEIPGCGHYPEYTHAPLVAELIRRFLTPPQCPTAGC